MPKIIEIRIGPKGEIQLETKGFTGAACREASRFLEQALGSVTAETLTAAFYQAQPAEQDLRQSR